MPAVTGTPTVCTSPGSRERVGGPAGGVAVAGDVLGIAGACRFRFRVWVVPRDTSSWWLSTPNGVQAGMSFVTIKLVSLDDYKVVLYRNEPSGWVAEVPSIPGCHALMPTREAALSELVAVFQMIAEEYAERDQTLPVDTTEIIHA